MNCVKIITSNVLWCIGVIFINFCSLFITNNCCSIVTLHTHRINWWKSVETKEWYVKLKCLLTKLTTNDVCLYCKRTLLELKSIDKVRTILREYKLGVKVKFLGTKLYALFYVCVFPRISTFFGFTSSIIRHDNRLLSFRQRATTGIPGTRRRNYLESVADERPAPKNAVILGIGRWVLKYDRFAGRVFVVKCRSERMPRYRVPGRKRPSRMGRVSEGLPSSTRECGGSAMKRGYRLVVRLNCERLIPHSYRRQTPPTFRSFVKKVDSNQPNVSLRTSHSIGGHCHEIGLQSNVSETHTTD